MALQICWRHAICLTYILSVAALKETERASGMTFVEDKLPRSSMLLQVDHPLKVVSSTKASTLLATQHAIVPSPNRMFAKLASLWFQPGLCCNCMDTLWYNIINLMTLSMLTLVITNWLQSLQLRIYRIHKHSTHSFWQQRHFQQQQPKDSLQKSNEIYQTREERLEVADGHEEEGKSSRTPTFT